MIAAHQYVKEHTDDFYDLDADQAKFEREEAFTGCELVHDTHRLALMNAMLHDIDGQILLADTLSNQGKALHDFDLVLTNPPFGTKKGGERATRDDFTFPTSNKQLNLMFTYDRIMPPSENTAVNRIGVLFREGLLTQDLVDILHALRKVRNKAVHENYSSVEEGKVLLQMAHSLCEWFMQTYGDWNYQTVPFVMPTDSQEQDIADTDDAQEESLVKEAEEKAAASSNSVTKEKRRQQAAKAASQRQKTEAETRYIIDQQLRQVGWEADTENLRFSNGTRPALPLP